MPKYSKEAQEEVKNEMHLFKQGQAKSGKAEKPVKSRKQAVAIGLSKARKKGAKVPKKPVKTKKATKAKKNAKKSSKAKNTKKQ